jgi:hypothetical protein
MNTTNTPTLADHQGICLDVIAAYSQLNLVNQAELERAFSGDMNVHSIHQLAKRMLADTSPEGMALVVARLVMMANEAPLTSEDIAGPGRFSFADLFAASSAMGAFDDQVRASKTAAVAAEGDGLARHGCRWGHDATITCPDCAHLGAVDARNPMHKGAEERAMRRAEVQTRADELFGSVFEAFAQGDSGIGKPVAGG